MKILSVLFSKKTIIQYFLHLCFFISYFLTPSDIIEPLFNITGNSYRLKDKIIQDDINDKSGEFYFDIYNRFSFFI